MSDINSDLIAQEVDDEVRRERMHNLWKAYSKYVIGGAVGIVLVVAGREIYNWRVTNVQSAHSEAFATALQEAGAEGADAVAVWQNALPALGDNYGALAQLRLAAAAAEKGNVSEALATYDALAASSAAEEMVRELASLKAAMLLAGKQGDLDTAKGRLAPLAIKGKAWYFSAQEQLALIDLRQKDMEAALAKFVVLADDAETPQTIRARATQFRNFIEAQQFAAGAADKEEATADTASEEDGQ